MSAETLRKAAALMRERAEAACPSPWRLGEHATLGPNEVWGDDDGWNASAVATTRTRLNPGGTFHADADAEHIASWHPAVALAVALWLEHAAARAEMKLLHGGGTEAVWSRERDALAVARAYLGEQA